MMASISFKFLQCQPDSCIALFQAKVYVDFRYCVQWVLCYKSLFIHETIQFFKKLDNTKCLPELACNNLLSFQLLEAFTLFGKRQKYEQFIILISDQKFFQFVCSSDPTSISSDYTNKNLVKGGNFFFFFFFGRQSHMLENVLVGVLAF